MKYCRINEQNQVVEIFPYNPFEWIPNEEFLKTCIECPDEINETYDYKNEEFVIRTSESTLEEKYEALKQQLETVQAALDQLLNGTV